jgi:hypothetical protein
MLGFGPDSNSSRYGGAKLSLPKEPIVATVQKNQIMQLDIPHQTPRAAGIRNYMHTHMLTDDQRPLKIWVYRPATKWTNVALDSTTQDPKLTWLPHATLHKIFLFEKCDDVSNVQVKKGPGFADEGQLILQEDIEGIEFDDIQPANTSVTNTPDRKMSDQAQDMNGNTTNSRLVRLEAKLDDTLTSVDTKIAHLLNLFEMNAKATNEDEDLNGSANAHVSDNDKYDDDDEVEIVESKPSKPSNSGRKRLQKTSECTDVDDDNGKGVFLPTQSRPKSRRRH